MGERGRKGILYRGGLTLVKSQSAIKESRLYSAHIHAWILNEQ